MQFAVSFSWLPSLVRLDDGPILPSAMAQLYRDTSLLITIQVLIVSDIVQQEQDDHSAVHFSVTQIGSKFAEGNLLVGIFSQHDQAVSESHTSANNSII